MTQAANILVVDDTPANLKLLTEMLTAQGYGVRVAPNGHLALQSVSAHPPDLILLDIRMPGLDGFQVCQALQAEEFARGIPVIFLSALEDTQYKVKAFNVGGVDYITKPFEGVEVLARVKTHLRLRQLQRQLTDQNRALEQVNANLDKLASTDPLTGLLNRRSFIQRCKADWPAAQGRHPVCGLVLFDIDHFKSVNDQFGHDVGDTVLQQVTQRIASGLRARDLFARWGGEEFILWLPNNPLEPCQQLAERLRARIHNDPIPPVGSITASFGVVATRAGEDLDSLIKRADQALYSAKQAGRNCVKTE